MSVEAIDAAWVRVHPLPVVGDGGKEERGRVLVVGGGADLLGAACLAGEAALRAGAGKLQLTAPPMAQAALSLAMPEARILPLPEEADGFEPDQDLARCLEHCDAALIGPGMVARHEALATNLARRARGPLVLDAGALAAAGVVEDPASRLVLTPHSGEMAQLLNVSKTAIEADPLDAAETAARRFGAVIVMKGASTFVVSPHGSATRYAGGGLGLGVSGSGDVLAGAIAGLLARGADPFVAAAWGVYLHGEAGRRLAEEIGTIGFLAREIPARIPALLQA